MARYNYEDWHGEGWYGEDWDGVDGGLDGSDEEDADEYPFFDSTWPAE